MQQMAHPLCLWRLSTHDLLSLVCRSLLPPLAHCAHPAGAMHHKKKNFRFLICSPLRACLSHTRLRKQGQGRSHTP